MRYQFLPVLCYFLLVPRFCFSAPPPCYQFRLLGSYRQEWGLPSDTSFLCYCYGSDSSRDLDVEIGLLALTDSVVIVAGQEQQRRIVSVLQEQIMQAKVSYVDYAAVLSVSPHCAQRILFHEDASSLAACSPDGKVVLLVVHELREPDPFIAQQVLQQLCPELICIDDACCVVGQQRLTAYLAAHDYVPLYQKNSCITFGKRGYAVSHQLPVVTLQHEDDVDREKVPRLQVIWPALFNEEPVKTEYNAYLAFARQEGHLPAPYVALAWSPLINHSNNPRLGPPYLHELPVIEGDGGFTVCQNIHYARILSLLKSVHIATLFTPHVDRHYFGLTVVPFPHYAANGLPPASHKDIWYSFVGADNHPVKREIFAMSHPGEAVIIQRQHWHFERDVFHPQCMSAEEQERERKEYQDVLSRSRFSLCPRGTGVSTIRFWESLQAGAIPILIADNMQLPGGIEWDKCILRLPEDSVAHLRALLDSVDHEREKEMRKECLAAFETLCRDDNFIQTICHFYAKEAGAQ